MPRNTEFLSTGGSHCACFVPSHQPDDDNSDGKAQRRPCGSGKNGALFKQASFSSGNATSLTGGFLIWLLRPVAAGSASVAISDVSRSEGKWKMTTAKEKYSSSRIPAQVSSQGSSRIRHDGIRPCRFPSFKIVARRVSRALVCLMWNGSRVFAWRRMKVVPSRVEWGGG
jgi:hypothetical protein